MPDPQIGQGYKQDIAYRYKPGQAQAEFYSQKTQQVFNDPTALATYLNQNYQGAGATPENVFGVLASGYTPRAQALDQITNQLNQQQNQTFQEQQQPAKRQSSAIQESINAENKNLNDALAEFNTLKTKLTSLQTPNYQQTYSDLRSQAGIPGLERHPA
jgi:hypothetical protein